MEDKEYFALQELLDVLEWNTGYCEDGDEEFYYERICEAYYKYKTMLKGDESA